MNRLVGRWSSLDKNMVEKVTYKGNNMAELMKLIDYISATDEWLHSFVATNACYEDVCCHHC